MANIYVEVAGRLGNQLFQYAFARKLQILTGGNLIFDFKGLGLNRSLGQTGKQGWENSLEHFNVAPYEYVDNGNYDKRRIPKLQRFMYGRACSLKWKLPNELWRARMEAIDHAFLQLFGIIYLEAPNSFAHLRWPRHNRNLFVKGYFESAQYFGDIADILRKEFTPKYPIPDNCKELLKTLSEEESICVSVRRGDFVTIRRHNVCNIQYYKDAVACIRAKKPDALVFVCSDDVEWCKQNLDFGKHVIFEPAGLPVWEKLRIMSACHHFVISNSSFSWWCQFLSPHKDKIVVAPSVWVNGMIVPHDIYQDNWILLDIKNDSSQ